MSVAHEEILLNWFRDFSAPNLRVIVAFSGGVDSSLVLAGAVRAIGRDRVIAAIADSPSLARAELSEALELAQTLGAAVKVFPTNELSLEAYQRNDANRCYYCKSTLYSHLQAALVTHYGPDFGHQLVVDGTNLDDLQEIRPGLKAADSAGVRHPLAECRFNKTLVRELSLEWGLPTYNKPAMACLASRLARGTAVSPERLAIVESAEELLKKLGVFGARVRLHELRAASEEQKSPELLARVELPETFLANLAQQDILPSMQAQLTAVMKSQGCAFVTLDLEGYRKGGFAKL